MAKKRKWTNEQLIEAVKDCRSIRQILKRLDLNPTGGNYAQMRKYIKELNIDFVHLNTDGYGQGWKKGDSTPVVKAAPLQEILVENRVYQSFKLKERLLKEGIFEHICSDCGLDTWKGKPIPIHLDHINGINTDNRLENLRLLCPNCHALTPTYAGKNRGNYGGLQHKEAKKSKTISQEYLERGLFTFTKVKRKPIVNCLICGNVVNNRSGTKYCSTTCTHISQRKTNWPTKEKLQELISKHPWIHVGRLYGVSDNAVRKWAKYYGLPTKNIKRKKTVDV